MARGLFGAQKSPEAQLMWKAIFPTPSPSEFRKAGVQPTRGTPLPPRPADVAPSQKVLRPLPEAVCALATPPAARRSQPMKTLRSLSWLKANLILQTPAALGLFHNGQVCREGLPGCGSVWGGTCGVCVYACMCACAYACMCACARTWSVLCRRTAHLCTWSACAHAPTCGQPG